MNLSMLTLVVVLSFAGAIAIDTTVWYDPGIAIYEEYGNGKEE